MTLHATSADELAAGFRSHNLCIPFENLELSNPDANFPVLGVLEPKYLPSCSQTWGGKSLLILTLWKNAGHLITHPCREELTIAKPLAIAILERLI